MNLERIENISFQNNVLIFFDVEKELFNYQILQLSNLIEFLKLKKLSIHCIPVHYSSNSNDEDFINNIYQNISKYFPTKLLENTKEIQENKTNKNEVILLHPKLFFFKWNHIASINYDNYVIHSFNFITSFKQDAHFKNIEIKRFCMSFYVNEVIELLTQLQNAKAKPKVGIFGGIQIKKIIEFLDKNVKNFQFILFGGSIGITALKANGLNIGNSTYHRDEISPLFQIIHKANFEECSVELPVDHIIAEQISPKAKTKLSSREIQPPYVAIDIGSKTIQLYEQIIKQANLILFHAPLGIIELEKGNKGTLELLKIIQKLKKPTIISGVELCNFAINHIQVNTEIKIVPYFDFIIRYLNQNINFFNNF